MNARRALRLLILAAGPAGAQEVNLARLGEGSQNRVSLRTGAEYGVVTGLGYSREVPALGRTVLLGADVAVPWGGFDVGDWRMRVNALVPIVGGERWKLAGSFSSRPRPGRRGRVLRARVVRRPGRGRRLELRHVHREQRPLPSARLRGRVWQPAWDGDTMKDGEDAFPPIAAGLHPHLSAAPDAARSGGARLPQPGLEPGYEDSGGCRRITAPSKCCFGYGNDGTASAGRIESSTFTCSVSWRRARSNS